MTSNSDRLFAPPPDDIDQMFAEVAQEIGPDPADLARAQAERARQWLTDMAAGKGIRWYWPTIQALTGRLLPGAVFVGGYPKVAKTTLLQTQARAWAESGTAVCYIGTETSQEILKLQSAALTLGLPVHRVVAPDEDDPLSPHDLERIHADLERQTALAADGLLMYAEDDKQDLASALYWLRWGARNGAKVVVYDHMHRMNLSATGQDYYQALPMAIKAMNTAAVANGVVGLYAAQLREDSHDKLANHEPPGDRQWFGGSDFQREATAALQLYRPFRRGTTAKQKKAVKMGQTPLREILAVDTIGIRCSAHRFLQTAGELRTLRIVGDQITEWPEHHNDPPPPSDGWWQR